MLHHAKWCFQLQYSSISRLRGFESTSISLNTHTHTLSLPPLTGWCLEICVLQRVLLDLQRRRPARVSSPPGLCSASSATSHSPGYLESLHGHTDTSQTQQEREKKESILAPIVLWKFQTWRYTVASAKQLNSELCLDERFKRYCEIGLSLH